MTITMTNPRPLNFKKARAMDEFLRDKLKQELPRFKELTHAVAAFKKAWDGKNYDGLDFFIQPIDTIQIAMKEKLMTPEDPGYHEDSNSRMALGHFREVDEDSTHKEIFETLASRFHANNNRYLSFVFDQYNATAKKHYQLPDLSHDTLFLCVQRMTYLVTQGIHSEFKTIKKLRDCLAVHEAPSSDEFKDVDVYIELTGFGRLTPVSIKSLSSLRTEFIAGYRKAHHTPEVYLGVNREGKFVTVADSKLRIYIKTLLKFSEIVTFVDDFSDEQSPREVIDPSYYANDDEIVERIVTKTAIDRVHEKRRREEWKRRNAFKTKAEIARARINKQNRKY